MSVDLRNYVQVNINYHESKPLNRSRDTVVLFTVNTDDSAPQGRLNTHVPSGASEPVDYYTSLADYLGAIKAWNDDESHSKAQIVDNKTNPVLYNFVKCYFANGGVKLRVVGTDSIPAKGKTPTDSEIAAWIEEQMADLPAEDIVITSDCDIDVLLEVASSSGTTNTVANPITDRNSVETFSGYKEKMFISSTFDIKETISNPELYPNFVVKYGGKGIEMAAAAYLSKMSINDPASISDYCYTIEDVSMFPGSVIDDNDDMVAITGKDFNIDTTLVNNTRNVTGNTVSGYDMMNYYMRIVLTQTLTDAIVNVLVTKIKFDRSGINRVANAITQELNVYKSNGYLNSEAVWDRDDLYYSYNGEDYLVCARNTPLKMGYKFSILPISALTQEQRDAHAFPPVYVLIADAVSIRTIVINGDAY